MKDAKEKWARLWTALAVLAVIWSLAMLGDQIIHWMKYGWWRQRPVSEFLGDWGASMEWRGIGKVVSWLMNETNAMVLPFLLAWVFWVPANQFWEEAEQERIQAAREALRNHQEGQEDA